MDKKKFLFILEILEFILSIIAIVIFTLLFRLEIHNIRYIFLIGDCYVIYSFAKTISSLETKIEEKFPKNVEKQVKLKSVKKLSV